MMRFLCRLGAGLVVLSWLGGAAFGAEGDVVFKRESAEGETPPAVFPHWSHRIRYKCYVCHPGVFKMQANAEAITMDAIMNGKFCGVCHNGTIAWPVTFDTCNRCHTPK